MFCLGTFALPHAAPRSGLSLTFQPSLPSVGLTIRTSSSSSEQPVAQERHKSVSVYDDDFSGDPGVRRPLLR
jgi:hypothetical protein